MIYADFTYYAGTYLGAMTEEDFTRCAVRASSFLDYFTQDKAKDNADLDALKMCCCALCDNYKVIDMAERLAVKKLAGAIETDAEVKSETVGGYSRTVDTGAGGALSALNAADGGKTLLANTCREYLAHTGLLYRGGGRGVCTLPTL